MYRYALLGVFLSLFSLSAWAHDYWLKPENGSAVLIYGHANESEAYKPEVVKSVTGWDDTGKSRELSKSFDKGRLSLTGPGITAWAVEIDNGYWSKTIQGWKNRSKRQEKKAIKSTWDRHFAKSVSGKNITFVAGQPLEIVLSSASPSKIEGSVLLRGKPAAGLTIEQDHKKLGTTDANGKFSAKPSGTGIVVLGTRQQEKLERNPDADFLNLDATLTVTIK